MNAPILLLSPMRDQQKIREDAHLTLRVIAQHKKRVYKQHILRLNGRLFLRAKHRQLL